MKTILTSLALVLCLNCVAQNFYVSIATGFVPYQSHGYFNAQLTVGRDLSKHSFLEYNQTVAATTLAFVPSFFQVRGGYRCVIGRNTDLRLFVGYGVRPAYSNEVGKIKSSVTYGCYLFQRIEDSFYMKYEIAMNGSKFMPSIGIGTTF